MYTCCVTETGTAAGLRGCVLIGKTGRGSQYGQ